MPIGALRHQFAFAHRLGTPYERAFRARIRALAAISRGWPSLDEPGIVPLLESDPRGRSRTERATTPDPSSVQPPGRALLRSSLMAQEGRDQGAPGPNACLPGLLRRSSSSPPASRPSSCPRVCRTTPNAACRVALLRSEPAWSGGRASSMPRSAERAEARRSCHLLRATIGRSTAAPVTTRSRQRARSRQPSGLRVPGAFLGHSRAVRVARGEAAEVYCAGAAEVLTNSRCSDAYGRCRRTARAECRSNSDQIVLGACSTPARVGPSGRRSSLASRGEPPQASL